MTRFPFKKKISLVAKKQNASPVLLCKLYNNAFIYFNDRTT